MKIRLTGTRQECDNALARLQRAFHVLTVSDDYRQRGGSTRVHVYVEVRLS